MTEETTTKRPRRMAREAKPKAPSAPPAAKPQSKGALVEDLLQQSGGASLDDLCQATGWLPHTCRAFLTGLRKKGRTVERSKREDGVTIYRIAATQAAA
ncbi:DUF3489 domain-containing protein [Novosphingobium sp.]|uniref:DUF3489 domain-containing protein n=1 Tax=Novosphingobium sp. TaxID=1874826 RepID=UPI001EB62A2D|nr:DUF3489 domain-containing protein [Novosphingobium sp.]MBK6801976.1 DUF3489 domain-containing protein [Novosphingobium sp.]MBK9010208.1 DUF3489 domain-containing protein [Novosphingobium sp.]